MRKTLFVAVVVLCLGVAASPAARAQGLLPASFGAWSAASPAQPLSAADLEQTAGSDGPVLQEYKIEGGAHRSYAQAAETASVTVYHLADPSAAYGLYTFSRSDALAPIEAGSFGCASANRALIVVGNLLIDVTAPRARPSDADLKMLAQNLVAQADGSPFPILGQFLPDDGLVRRSEHYFVGPQALARVVPLGTDDWVGFGYSAEALTARYHLGGASVASAANRAGGANGVGGAQDATLLLVSYPTQQIAAQQFDAMMRRFPIDPPGGAAAGQPVLYGRRISEMVALVVGAPTRAAANSLLDQIQSGDQVTWNEPKTKLTDPSISNIVIQSFLGTGAIMLLAVAAGIGFGGVRLLVKYFLPGRVFDREKQLEILQMGINSKPIRSKDFY
jgi:hypothetical protein